MTKLCSWCKSEIGHVCTECASEDFTRTDFSLDTLLHAFGIANEVTDPRSNLSKTQSFAVFGVIVCLACGNVTLDVLESITHGICAECYAQSKPAAVTRDRQEMAR